MAPERGSDGDGSEADDAAPAQRMTHAHDSPPRAAPPPDGVGACPHARTSANDAANGYANSRAVAFGNPLTERGTLLVL